MNYAISGGHPVTVAAAEEVLREGGNAVDAAIAAYLTAWVAEPCMTSGGGGGFAMVFSAERGEARLFDGFCQTPGRKRPEREQEFVPIEVDFGGNREVFQAGLGAAAVPGAVALVFSLHERYGSRPLPELARPAIEAAREGVLVDDFQYLNFQLLEPILRMRPQSDPLFFPGGELIGPGERMRMPGLADFLDYLTREGRDAFYRGEVARSVAAACREEGGHLSREDFENYQVIVREPLQLSYRGRRLLTNPPPSIGGALIVLACERLRAHAGAWPHFLGSDHLRLQYDLWTHLGAEDRRPEELLADWQKRNAQKRGSTTHFNIVDRRGNAVSLSSSNGEGCGYFIPYTDIQLNNMLGEAALLPEGFHSWRPDVRLSSMMAPTIVLDEKDRPQIVLGSGGAGRIASAITQVLHLLIDHQSRADEAVRAPRVHLANGEFNVEAGFGEQLPPGSISDRLVEWEKYSLFFGGVHTLARRGDRWEGAGDHRRDGVARVAEG